MSTRERLEDYVNKLNAYETMQIAQIALNQLTDEDKLKLLKEELTIFEVEELMYYFGF